MTRVLDGDGNVLSFPDGTSDLQLAPGESISHYYPPSGTQTIVFVCHKECEGQAVLEFDTPNAMPDNRDNDPNVCATRMVQAPDGQNIPVPVGGIGLPDGSSAITRDNADVNILIKDDGSYYVAVDNADPSNNEAQGLFGDLAGHAGIAKLEQMAADAFSKATHFPFRFVGLALSVLVSVFTSTQLTQEIFIRSSLDMGTPVDGPPVTYVLLI